MGGFKPCLCEFHFFVPHCIIWVKTVKTDFLNEFFHSFSSKSFSCIITFSHARTKFYIDVIDSFARIVSMFHSWFFLNGLLFAGTQYRWDYSLYTVSLWIANYLAHSHYCQLFLSFTVCLTEFDNCRGQTLFYEKKRVAGIAMIILFITNNFIW